MLMGLPGWVLKRVKMIKVLPEFWPGIPFLKEEFLIRIFSVINLVIIPVLHNHYTVMINEQIEQIGVRPVIFIVKKIICPENTKPGDCNIPEAFPSDIKIIVPCCTPVRMY